MPRLYLTAEGETEQAFTVDVLRPHLALCGVSVFKPRLAALGKKKGHTHRGGLRRYLPVKNDICRWLKQDRAVDARFTTMFDLYGLPDDFPGFGAASRTTSVLTRVEMLERALAVDIDEPRFIPYIQLHEFEALLLSYPTAFACQYPDRVREIARLERLCSEYDSPEDIDDGQHSAPSKRIAGEIPEYVDAKRSAGPLIAIEIGLERIREKCPHFNAWLTRLESLATT